MKYLRKFDSTAEMTAAIQADKVSFLGLVQPQGQTPELNIHVHVPILPNNLVISCSNNTVTISATNATTIEYNTDGGSTYTTYTQPFKITETVTVYAKAINSDGSIEGSQQCVYADYSIPFYIEDVSGNDNTVQIKKNDSYSPTLAIEKSTDGTTWTSMGSTSTGGISATIPANSKLYLRCRANNWYNNTHFNKIDTTGNCNVGGNVMSLLYGDNFTGNETTFPSETTYCLARLFYQNMHIINASNLLLPATTLANYCYYQMFYYCTALTTAPVLPATTLATYCYSGMFTNCTSLTTAPALPVTTLAGQCYSGMFTNCTSLTTAPALPATTLAANCYYNMFNGCTSLTTAPTTLPATTLASACYRNMFGGCTALTTAPALPATTLADNCYTQMFSSCTSLTIAPALPATTLASNCYNAMFQGCTSLTTAPTLSATTLATQCYASMFSGCTALTTAPALPVTTLATQCYQSMFNGCTGLTTAPALPATTLATQCYASMFGGCTSLTTAPELPATTLTNQCYSYMFSNCSNLNYIKCLATSISASNCTNNWVNGVAATGTFVKNSSMESWTEGTSGIPSGWTVQDATE